MDITAGTTPAQLAHHLMTDHGWSNVNGMTFSDMRAAHVIAHEQSDASN